MNIFERERDREWISNWKYFNRKLKWACLLISPPPTKLNLLRLLLHIPVKTTQSQDTSRTSGCMKISFCDTNSVLNGKLSRWSSAHLTAGPWSQAISHCDFQNSVAWLNFLPPADVWYVGTQSLSSSFCSKLVGCNRKKKSRYRVLLTSWIQLKDLFMINNIVRIHLKLILSLEQSVTQLFQKGLHRLTHTHTLGHSMLSIKGSYRREH